MKIYRLSNVLASKLSPTRHKSRSQCVCRTLLLVRHYSICSNPIRVTRLLEMPKRIRRRLSCKSISHWRPSSGAQEVSEEEAAPPRRPCQLLNENSTLKFDRWQWNRFLSLAKEELSFHSSQERSAPGAAETKKSGKNHYIYHDVRRSNTLSRP